MKNRDNLPVACSLTTRELSDREASLLAQFRSRAIETKELQQGYAFQFPGDGKSIELIAELIAAERKCCPFLALAARVARVHGTIFAPFDTRNSLRFWHGYLR